MLKSLSIENYAIISRVDIDFDSRLNIITGETGAGKSIILGALGLVMGQRADSKVLFDTQNKCIVEATFTNYNKAVDGLLSSHDLDSEQELIIRREITTSGRSRAFVNDTPTKLEVLQKLSLELIDLNQQFQIIEIQNKNFQLNLIDALASTETQLAKYKTLYKALRSDQQELEELIAMESSQMKELDFMKFQLGELETAALTAGEQGQMEGEMTLLEKADDIASLMEETKFVLVDSDSNLRDNFAALAKKWSAFKEVDPLATESYEILVELQEQITNLYNHADAVEAKVESNPSKLMELRSRLDTIYTLQKKHGVQNIASLLDIQTALSDKLNQITNRTDIISKLEQKIADAEKELKKLGGALTKKRKKVFAQLEKDVNAKLQALSMGSAQIKVSHVLAEKFRADGMDDISILFKANKGTDFQPIKKVASGGESARLMLSLKATVAHAMSLPTMIFDEIDTGVSGEVAGKMGDILKELSEQHQLLCITHSPQVSARAIRHFFVYKEETKTRTTTHVKILDKTERITEIAKMLSGDPPSTFAIDNAKDLITN